MDKKEMLSASMVSYIKQLPKVDLHVHLEGSIKPELLMELAERNKIRLPCSVQDELQQLFVFRDFDHFSQRFALVTSCLITRADYALIAYEFGKECARQHIVYAEVTFSIETNCRQTGLPWRSILDALNEGRFKAQADFGIRWNWVFDILRDEPETQKTILARAHESMAMGVVALGLTAPEDSISVQLFEDTFAKAREYGLASVPHAGETGGPRSIWDTLRHLSPTRIGHGIRCIEDPSLIEELRQKKMPLEICITSNVSLGVVPDNLHHPIRKLWDAGLFITIASDDPALFNTTLSQEYELLAAIYGFDEKMLEQMSLNGAYASSLPKDEKEQLALTIMNESMKLRQDLFQLM